MQLDWATSYFDSLVKCALNCGLPTRQHISCIHNTWWQQRFFKILTDTSQKLQMMFVAPTQPKCDSNSTSIFFPASNIEFDCYWYYYCGGLNLFGDSTAWSDKFHYPGIQSSYLNEFWLWIGGILREKAFEEGSKQCLKIDTVGFLIIRTPY